MRHVLSHAPQADRSLERQIQTWGHIIFDYDDHRLAEEQMMINRNMDIMRHCLAQRKGQAWFLVAR